MTTANAVEEAAKEGKHLAVPYWRTLKAKGFLNEKYPGGQEAQKKLLEAEGFQVIARGKKYQVTGYEKYLIEP
jgi:alkylated DNA nucleotide flippase Atl1